MESNQAPCSTGPNGVTIEVEKLEVRYGKAITIQVEDLRLKGPALIQILGPNGAGKTTLLKTMLGLIKPNKGKVFMCGEEVTANPRKAGRYAGYVPQTIVQGSHYPITPLELVSYELRLRGVRKPVDEIKKVLNAIGLSEDTWNKPLRELSGGQRQRAFIAKALAHDPYILLMDEPFSAVDPRGRAALARFIGKLGKERLVVVTSHDPMLLLPYTSYIVLLNKRVIAVGRPREVLDVDLLKRVYGEAVIWVERHVHISDSHVAT